MKKFIKNPWVIAVGSTVIGGVLLSFVLDWIKGVDWLSTLKVVIKFIANIIAIYDGNKLLIIPKLSFTPSINTSYISTFFKKPCNTIKRTNKGIIKLDM